VGLVALAALAGCRPKLDMSGASYVGRGAASLDFRVDGRSGTLTKDAAWGAVRLNEVGKGGAWYLDFNDLAVTEGAPPPAKAYVSIELPAHPVVGTFRAVVTCEIYKAARVTSERILWSRFATHAELILEKVELAAGGAFAGRVSFVKGETYVRGRFDLCLDDAPPLVFTTN
jgi:hypothetical protein